MAIVLKIGKAIRNNWKKSAFATCGLLFSFKYIKEKYQINQLMRQYCEEAVKYGDQLLPLSKEPNRFVVLLNPAADKKSAKETFETFCEPILNLAGFYVEIVLTDSEGHACRYVESLPKLPTGILVAGGDGTVSEAITGLFRRTDGQTCPIGILPVGETNNIGKSLFAATKGPMNNVEQANTLANAAISAVRGQIEKKDAMKIELISNQEDDSPPVRPIYAVGSLQWGAFRDIKSKKDSYWYTDGFREYMAFLFNAFSNDITWTCKAKLIYTDPCHGCRNCRSVIENYKQTQNTRWWAKFIPRPKPTAPHGIDYSKIVNENCNYSHELLVESTDIILNTRTVESDQAQIPKLTLKLSGVLKNGFGYMYDAWYKIKAPQIHAPSQSIVEAKTIEIIPETDETEANTRFYSIDNENFEVRPIRISIVPEALQMFVSQ